MEKITKARLKEIKELLRDKKVRDDKGLFVIEGEKIVRDVVSKGYVPVLVCVASSFAESGNNKQFLQFLSVSGIPAASAADTDLEKVSSLRSSQGILAVIEKKEQTKNAIMQSGPDLIVLADGVQDPGNIGTLIRSAAAFGAGCVLLAGESADIYNPKVVRASSGAIFDVPVLKCGINDIRDLKGNGYKLFVSKVDKRETLTVEEMASVSKGLIVAFGSEGAGVSDVISSEADEYFYIPINDNTESLNVAAAAAVTLYAIARQGRIKG